MEYTVAQIQEQGLLERYVIGGLSPMQHDAVQRAIEKYPELKQELGEIESALGSYAFANAIPPSESVLASTLNSLDGSTPTQTTPAQVKAFSWTTPLAAVGLLLLAGCLYFYSTTRSLIQEAEENLLALKNCQKEQVQKDVSIAILNDLQRRDNEVLAVNSTDKYPDTKLTIINNATTQRNYIQIEQLPALGEGQAFQLWSLKPDSDPIPLDVFDSEQRILPVTYIEGTNAYAITIELAAGARTPNLEELIGVIPVSS